MPKPRADQRGEHHTAYMKNKERIFMTQSVCGICGRPVDKSLKWPDPMSKCVDHIIPIAKGGHPSDISNLQLAHWTCNRQKADKLLRDEKGKIVEKPAEISNRNLPLSRDWTAYHG